MVDTETGVNSASSARREDEHVEDNEDAEDLMAENEEDCQATIMSTVFNLSNNIVGAGILTLPYCFKEASIVEGALLMIFVGILSGLSLVLIAVCCDVTQCFSFRGMGERTLGRGFGITIQSIMFIYTFFSCVSFMILAGDFFSGSNGIPQGFCSGKECDSWIVQIFYSRFSSVAILTLLVLAPLSCLRNLNALRFTSLLSMVGMFYLLFLLVTEYFAASKRGEVAPSSEIKVATLSWGIFSAAPVVNVAFIAHYNVPRFYQEMHQRSVTKFATSVAISLSLCGAVYIAVALFGYLHFGEATMSDVLSNFGKNSLKATIGRVAMSAVVLFTYPLAFNSLRASAMALLALHFPTLNFRVSRIYFPLTLTLVGLTFILGSTLSDIGVVLDYKGAILGGCISFAFPAWMFLARCNPTKVQSCCVKPVQFSSSSGGMHEPLLTGLSSADGFSESRLAFWTRTSYIFFVWAIVSGVLGVIITTLKLVQEN